MTLISKIWKEATSISSNENNYRALEVVDPVSETQLQVGENSNKIIWQLKGKNITYMGQMGHKYPFNTEQTSIQFSLTIQ